MSCATSVTGVDAVVKLGGSLLSHRSDFGAVLAAIEAASDGHSLLVVPGGGPFADAVRQLDAAIGLSDDAAHWMAILGMDQYAHAIVARLRTAELVSDRVEIASALARRRVPVLAPSRWMRADDPLPHSWAVTSDSIAAWVAGALGTSRLVLIKPPGATGARMVDDYFQHALPAGLTYDIVPADRLELLHSALRGGRAEP